LKLHVAIEQWPLAAPVRIAGHTFENVQVVVVTLESHGHTGRGEAAGVYYKNDAPASMAAQLESLRSRIEAGVSRDAIQALLPPGGARNALDCAWWDLEARRSGRPAWELAGLEAPRPLLTTFTCGADDPERMAATARAYQKAQAIKLKLTGEPVDFDRVKAVRDALPDVWLGVDANQSFTRSFLERLMPLLIDLRVDLIEQPVRVGEEEQLDGLQSPIPIAADESVQSRADILALPGRFKVINIKLDKCGGLTEALAMIRLARSLGLDTMVGCMPGTSLAMAPAFLLGSLCDVVDLDAPVFLKADRSIAVRYRDGIAHYPDALWG
jgi:L-alanine-DL-glutamate epimerase-like enolase superfamily enzyme